MLWELRYRRDEFSIESGIAKGRDLPDWFLDRPELLPGEEFYLKSFWILSTERPATGTSISPIPWSKVIQYALFRGLDQDLLDPFWQTIAAMDGAFQGWMKNEHDRYVRQQKSKTAKTKSPARRPSRSARSFAR